jgi:hypothetical protein
MLLGLWLTYCALIAFMWIVGGIELLVKRVFRSLKRRAT